MSDAGSPPPIQTRAELESSLAEYEAQLEQVTALLAADPANAEYLEIKAGLDEVIELTRDLVKEAPAGDGGGGGAAAAATAAAVDAAATTTTAAAPPPPAPKRSRWEAVEEAPGAVAGGPPARLPPPPPPSDEQPWESTGEAAAGPPAAAEPDDEPAYAALPAPKRGKVAATPAVVEEMPAWMVITEADDEKAAARKRALQKSFKQKQRFAAMDLAASQKANSWQAFASGKGAKAKPGFLSTTAKPSLFSTGGVGARVGVVAGRPGGGGGGGGGSAGRGRPPPPVRAGAPVRSKAPPPPPPPPAGQQ